MPASLIPSFLIYCYIGAITPGPANICSLSAALRYGKKAAFRQWWGLLSGFTCISLASAVVTWLLGAALNEHVGFLSWIGAAYLLWMAWHMLRSSGEIAEKDPAQPCFRTGFLVQMTNAKVMIYCLTAMSCYVLPYNQSLWYLLAVALFLPFTGPLANLVWLFAGLSLQRIFENHRRAADIIMAVALVLCAISMVWPH